MSSVVGIDVGGTFTDLVYSADGAAVTGVLKVPSTPQDPSLGLIDALGAAGIDVASLDMILHGTTIATNAVIERRGAHCALVTTEGFRDVLELGRRDRHSMYGLTGTQAPLIPRERRWEVAGRMDHQGRELVSLDEAYLERLAAGLAGEAVEAIVIAFLHSYANPAHEQRAKAIFERANPEWEVVASSDVVREYYEFERTSTAAVQGYLQPLVSRYATSLKGRLADLGFGRETLVMQSNGGLIPLARLGNHAANIVRSGPAAGVMAAARIAGEAGFDHVITGDMGGTSYDVAVVVKGEPRIAETTELDFRVPLRLPMIDVHTIGAGGGSIAYVDRGGMLQVGPRSAGAFPGPVCFGRGGTEPTVTDANAVLGRINADAPIGLKHLDRLAVEEARAAMAALGRPLGLDVEETAQAILTIVNARMARRTRLLTVERGLDPRDFVLVVFGGAGPLHGSSIMREVGIRTMLLPPHPGVLCALGCMVADLRYDMSRTIERPLGELDDAAVGEMLRQQREDGEERLAASGTRLEAVSHQHIAEMSYAGQIHPLRVAIDGSATLGDMERLFEQAYALEYGNTLGPIAKVLVSLKTTSHGLRRRAGAGTGGPRPAAQAVPVAHREVYFAGWVRTPIYRRETLGPGATFTGPAIIEQADTTTVLEPGLHARVDDHGNILVEAQ
ncbi:hydantoinase/oxoprolinase family protein [Novosphingobium colocasiae]|uniref:Hydantoinase n=1 Tax=Novosphingobium colocasiae TaxID=1256513 RepID=A0A918UDW4_9SPHN|nr:hydantoinase/oxoprolinase family protein [Novosphingobium colocasiae]GGY93259.1 hydantoinase [Novosphingobium colocasiae]